MPWIAFAYMSTMTYLVTASADAPPGGPAKPQARPIVGRARDGSRIGSRSHTASFSQSCEAPLLVALMVPDRKARLLLESSQASPPSSIVSFHKATANLTDSIVSLLLSATVLLSSPISLPPHDHR